MALDDEQRELVDAFRSQRRARNLRAMGEGLSGVGSAMRGQEVAVDEGFVRGGLEGEDAWMTSEEKRTELRDLELQMRQEQLQRDQMELEQRSALLGFLDSAMSRKMQREEGELDRELERALANARLRVEQARLYSTQIENNQSDMGLIADRAVEHMQEDQANYIQTAFEANAYNEALVPVYNSPEYREGDVLNAPVVSMRQVAEELNISGADEEIRAQIRALPREQVARTADDLWAATASRATASGQIFMTTGQEVARDRAANMAVNEAAQQDFSRNAINDAIRELHPNAAGSSEDPRMDMAGAERQELENQLTRRGHPVEIASPGSPGALSDAELWAQQHNRNRAMSSSAGNTVAQVAQAHPQEFDPTEIAQFQEAARMMGYTVRSDAQEAMQAAQESAGREGVTETQEIEQAGQVQQPQAEASWLGLPGLERPSDPREETLQAMEMIADMPELPPLQHARQQLIASPQFAQYQQDRGYTNEQETIREMVRESRQMDRQSRQDTREAARENRRLGIVPETDQEMTARREQENKPRNPEAPVEGGI